MDEYLLEINELRRRIAKLKAEEAPVAIIQELEAELRILRAIYNAALNLVAAGDADGRLKAGFRRAGMGDFTLENVYNYVYEEAVALDPEGHELASRISEHDFGAGLLATPAG
jgi:hypothetical protein